MARHSIGGVALERAARMVTGEPCADTAPNKLRGSQAATNQPICIGLHQKLQNAPPPHEQINCKRLQSTPH